MKRHTLLIITLLLFSAPNVWSQVGKPRTDLSVGGSAGILMNSVSFTPSVKQSLKMGMTGGVTARYICERYFNMICGFQAELNYAQAGWKENIDPTLQTYTYQRTAHYLQVPLMAHLGFGRERGGAKGFLNIGPQLGYCIGETEKRGGDWTYHNQLMAYNQAIDQHDIKIQQKFEYGIVGGLGFEFSTKKGHRFLLEGRYFFGLNSIFNDSKKDVFSRSANSNLSAKVSYLFDVIKTPNFEEPKRKKKKSKSENTEL